MYISLSALYSKIEKIIAEKRVYLYKKILSNIVSGSEDKKCYYTRHLKDSLYLKNK